MTEPERDDGYPSQVIPVALLVGVTIIGLVGVIPRLRWSGPLHAQLSAVGIALEVVLGALLAATFRQRPAAQLGLKLREGLKYLLGAAMAALFVLLLVNAHLRFGQAPRLPFRPQPVPFRSPGSPHPKGTAARGGSASWLLWVGLGVLIAAAITLALWLATRRRPAVRRPPRGGLAVDPEELKSALDEGAAALRAVDYDDARKAIIAAYLAMERRLGEKNAADTPDELLARATREGMIHGPAAGRLTGLFYEARFSSHPLGADKRDQALQALDELREQA